MTKEKIDRLHELEWLITEADRALLTDNFKDKNGLYYVCKNDQEFNDEFVALVERYREKYQKEIDEL